MNNYIARRYWSKSIAIFSISILLSQPLFASMPMNDVEKITINGDYRTRVEYDWNSTQSNGQKREDRTRLRVRARLGLKYKANDNMTLGFRIRTGSESSHQSPHTTIIDFNDNDAGESNVSFDKYYQQYSDQTTNLWIGKNSLPFWKQNEFFWDDDVTPVGIGYQYTSNNFSFNGGYFSLPVGVTANAGYLSSAQIVYNKSLAKQSIKIGFGLLNFISNDKDDDQLLLLDGNGNRNYKILVLSAQSKYNIHHTPITFGIDYLTNTETYSKNANDSFTAQQRDERMGYIMSVKYGDIKHQNQWLIAYYYANIGTFAVNSSYAQDDWLRWGTANESRSSNFSGHELRFAYALTGDTNIVVRNYIVKANKKRSINATSKEDGNRLRVDLNVKF